MAAMACRQILTCSAMNHALFIYIFLLLLLGNISLKNLWKLVFTSLFNPTQHLFSLLLAEEVLIPWKLHSWSPNLTTRLEMSLGHTAGPQNASKCIGIKAHWNAKQNAWNKMTSNKSNTAEILHGAEQSQVIVEKVRVLVVIPWFTQHHSQRLILHHYSLHEATFSQLLKYEIKMISCEQSRLGTI